MNVRKKKTRKFFGCENILEKFSFGSESFHFEVAENSFAARKKHQLKAHYRSHLMGTALEVFLLLASTRRWLKWRHLIFTPRREWNRKLITRRWRKGKLYSMCVRRLIPFFYDAGCKFSTRCRINNVKRWKKIRKVFFLYTVDARISTFSHIHEALCTSGWN